MSNDRILRIKEVCHLIGLQRSSVYEKINRKSPRYDPAFPAPVALGERAVGFRESQLVEWINTRERVWGGKAA